MSLIRPLHLAVLRWQARLTLVLGMREQALHLFETMNRLDPSNAYALSSRAQVEDQLGRHEAALSFTSQGHPT